MKRHIDNITILAKIGEQVNLPDLVIAKAPDGNYKSVSVDWDSYYVDTSKAQELIFKGTVEGYPHGVLLSVHVKALEENPPSVFPDEIDDFGLPKRDIHTADIPDIDDYQYFKSKVDRRPSENALLQELKELLADKIILARDINHMRNAIIEIEKFLRKLLDRIEDLEKRMDIVEGKIADLEAQMEAIATRKTLSRNGISVKTNEDGDTVIGHCTFIGLADWEGNHYEHFGVKLVDIDGSGGVYPSPLVVIGAGSEANYGGAVRMLKAADEFIIEMQLSKGKGYTGLSIGEKGAELYNAESTSRLNKDITGGHNAYSEWSKIPEKCMDSSTEPTLPPTGNDEDGSGGEFDDLEGHEDDIDYSNMTWEEKEYEQLQVKMRERGKRIHEKRFNDYITRGEMMSLIDNLTD